MITGDFLTWKTSSNVSVSIIQDKEQDNETAILPGLPLLKS
jgi:hypothetical protein